MDKGNQKVFRCQLLCEQESKKRDELQNRKNSAQNLAQERREVEPTGSQEDSRQ